MHICGYFSFINFAWEKQTHLTKYLIKMDKQIVIMKYLSVLGLKRVAWPPPPENSVNILTEQPVYTKVICVF
jgi:hypothetical protein